MFTGGFSNPLSVDEDYADISRDGHLLPFDVTWWRMLLTGQGFATRNWQFAPLPPRP